MRSTNSRTPSLRSWGFPLQGYKEPSLRMEDSLQCSQLLTIWHIPGFVGKLIKLWRPYALLSLAFERAVAGCWAYATAGGPLHFCRGWPLRLSQWVFTSAICENAEQNKLPWSQGASFLQISDFLKKNGNGIKLKNYLILILLQKKM